MVNSSRIRAHIVSLACAASYFFTALSYAQAPVRDDDEFVAEIFYTPQYVKNATGTVVEAEEVDEVQHEYGASITGQWLSAITELGLDYQHTDTRYNKESQPDGTFRDGESRFILGNDTTYYHLTMEHSIRRVLRAPGAATAVLENSEERQISRVVPMLRARINRANSLALAYSFTDVRFEDTEENSSKRYGLQFQYLRDVSPSMDASLRLGNNNVDYTVGDNADYDENFANIGVTVERRFIAYSLRAGVTEITPEVGEKEKSTTFDLRLTGDLAGNLFDVFGSRSISDSSVGNGNDAFFSEGVSFDGGGSDRDQIVRTAVGLSWDYEYLCSRCVLAVSIGREQADYLNLSENDSEQRFVDASLGYQMRRDLSVLFSYRNTDTKFTDDTAVQADATNTVSRIELSYQVNRMFELSLQHERDSRDVEGEGQATVCTTGLSAVLRFE